MEAEALKEKVEELTIDLEIIKQEISDSGVEEQPPALSSSNWSSRTTD